MASHTDSHPQTHLGTHPHEPALGQLHAHAGGHVHPHPHAHSPSTSPVAAPIPRFPASPRSVLMQPAAQRLAAAAALLILLWAAVAWALAERALP